MMVSFMDLCFQSCILVFHALEHVFLHDFESNILVPHHEAHDYMRAEMCLVCLMKIHEVSMFF